MSSEVHTISDSENDDENFFSLSSFGVEHAPSEPQTETIDNPTLQTPSLSKGKRKNVSKDEQLTAKEKRIAIKERRTAKKEEVMLKKMEMKKNAEMLKIAKPGECVKYITSYVDSSLLTTKYAGELLVALQSTGIQHKVKEQAIPFSISWSRKQLDESECEESDVLVVWTCDEFISQVYDRSFSSQISNIVQLHKKSITLIIFGIEEYFRHHKNQTNRHIKEAITIEGVPKIRKKKTDFDDLPVLSRTDVENALIELHLYSNVCHRFVETGQDLGMLVAQFTKSVAEKPYKLDKYKKQQENMNWFAWADGKDCVRVDNDGNGLLRMWQQQICQFTNIGLDIAQAIVSQYKSPTVLLQAYDKCTNRKEAELLLKDIPVRRGHGPLASTRKIGPELSKKMFILFNSEDPETYLSQE